MTARRVQRWVRGFFITWAIVSTLWLANTMRTRGVAAEMLRTTSTVTVDDRASVLEFKRSTPTSASALLFFCGSGVAAQAYAPLLRPVAEAGHPVFIVRLPFRFAPFDSHKEDAIGRARAVMRAHPEIAHWVVSGHSLGGALAARMVHADPAGVAAMVLIGTTHPKADDLSGLHIPVTKVYATNDGVAPPDRVQATKSLLPKQTKWIEIRGGNHSQFGHYGHQLFDGTAAITRAEQQSITRSAIIDALAAADPPRRDGL
jgi:pimeloyl-ACP methyl ester carboxylesterase